MSALTAAQLTLLGERLDTLENELGSLLDRTRDTVRPVELDQPIGRLSRMDAMQQQKLAQANRRRTEVRLRQVLAAKAALRTGSYGECKRCDEPIAFERLEARPEAPVCLSCQQELE